LRLFSYKKDVNKKAAQQLIKLKHKLLKSTNPLTLQFGDLIFMIDYGFKIQVPIKNRPKAACKIDLIFYSRSAR
jgi:hypothetical protein